LAGTVVGIVIVVTPVEMAELVVVNTEEPLVNVNTITSVLVNVDTVEVVVHTLLSPEESPLESPLGDCNVPSGTRVPVDCAAPVGAVCRSFWFVAVGLFLDVP